MDTVLNEFSVLSAVWERGSLAQTIALYQFTGLLYKLIQSYQQGKMI